MGRKKSETTDVQSTPDTATPDAAELLRRELEQERVRNQQLMQALIGARNEAAAATQLSEQAIREPLYPVTNLGLAAVGFTVFDDRGQPKDFLLAHKGAVAYLTLAQINEVREKSPSFFAKGYLSCEVVPTTVNTIPDPGAYLAALEYADISGEIAKLDSTQVLYALFAHIENQRFTHVDEQGRPLTDEEGHPRLETLEIDPKLMLVQAAVQQRLAALGGNSVSSDAA
jgi:hypothetical protein